MNGKRFKVSEFAEIVSGGTPSTRNPNYWDGKISWITPKDLSGYEHRYISVGERNITEEGLKNSSATMVPANTVLLTTRAPVGYVAVAENPLCTNQGFKNLVCHLDKAEPEFIYYLLKTNRELLESRATGATYKELSKSRLEVIQFFLPTLLTQRRISSILSSYDDLIDNNRRRIQLLEEAARLLFREWFVYLRFPGYERVKIADGVPEGWERIHLEDLVETQYGYTETATDEEIGPKFLRGTDINKNSYIDWSAVPYCTEQGLNFEKYALSKDDIVVIRMADPGKVAIIEKNIKAIFASYLVRLKIKPNAPLLPYFLFYKLSNEQYQGFIANASTGSTRQSASAKLLVNFHFVLPLLSLQEMFNDYIVPLRAQMNTLLDQNAALKKARDLLLPRLMSGKIEV